MPLFSWLVEFPSIPCTVGLSAVALIGYMVGRQARTQPVTHDSPDKMQEVLDGARQLEEITDEVLSVTREALDQCHKLRVYPEPSPTRPCPTAGRRSA
jgi:hypothetical protein